MEKKRVPGRSKGHPWEADDDFAEFAKFNAGSENARRNVAQNTRGYVTEDPATRTRTVSKEAPPTSGPPMGAGNAARGFAAGVGGAAKGIVTSAKGMVENFANRNFFGTEKKEQEQPRLPGRARTKRI